MEPEQNGIHGIDRRMKPRSFFFFFFWKIRGTVYAVTIETVVVFLQFFAPPYVCRKPWYPHKYGEILQMGLQLQYLPGGWATARLTAICEMKAIEDSRYSSCWITLLCTVRDIATLEKPNTQQHSQTLESTL